MEEHFANLDRVVMKTFGRVYTLTRPDGTTSTLEGVLTRDVRPTGAFDAVVQAQTELTVASSVQLQRNDRISTLAERWVVDRKLKDDGSLARWSLHADRS